MRGNVADATWQPGRGRRLRPRGLPIGLSRHCQPTRRQAVTHCRSPIGPPMLHQALAADGLAADAECATGHFCGTSPSVLRHGKPAFAVFADEPDLVSGSCATLRPDPPRIGTAGQAVLPPRSFPSMDMRMRSGRPGDSCGLEAGRNGHPQWCRRRLPDEGPQHAAHAAMSSAQWTVANSKPCSTTLCTASCSVSTVASGMPSAPKIRKNGLPSRMPART